MFQKSHESWSLNWLQVTNDVDTEIYKSHTVSGMWAQPPGISGGPGGQRSQSVTAMDSRGLFAALVYLSLIHFWRVRHGGTYLRSTLY